MGQCGHCTDDLIFGKNVVSILNKIANGCDVEIATEMTSTCGHVCHSWSMERTERNFKEIMGSYLFAASLQLFKFSSLFKNLEKKHK